MKNFRTLESFYRGRRRLYFRRNLRFLLDQNRRLQHHILAFFSFLLEWGKRTCCRFLSLERLNHHISRLSPKVTIFLLSNRSISRDLRKILPKFKELILLVIQTFWSFFSIKRERKLIEADCRVRIRTYIIFSFKRDHNRYSCCRLHWHSTCCNYSCYSTIRVCRQVDIVRHFFVQFYQIFFDNFFFLVFCHWRLEQTWNRSYFFKKICFSIEKVLFLDRKLLLNNLS